MRSLTMSVALTVCVAAGGHAQTLEDAAHEQGVQQHRTYLSELPFEGLDTLTGGLVLTFTDLVLPGNGGRQLRFQRTYSSHGVPDEGRHWSFGIAGMVMRIHEKPQPPSGAFDDYTLAEMLSWAPVLERADGAKIPTIFVATPRTDLPSTLDAVISPEFWRYHREGRMLFMPDGTICRYDDQGRLDEFSDPFGNTVDLVWGASTLEVRQRLGNDQERVVTIAIGGSTGLPGSMTYEGRTWTYHCGTQSWQECTQLTRATLPLGAPWEYEYHSQFGTLSLVRLPQGGEVLYGWERVTFDPPPGVPEVAETAITSRSTRDQGVVTGRWEYSYSRWDQEPHASTTTTPPGARISFFYGNVTPVPEVFAGRLRLTATTLELPQPGGGHAVVDSEDLFYHDPIPVVAHGLRRWGVPEIRRVDRRRHGRQHVTTLTYRDTDFGDYHHPHVITESGDTAVPGFVRTRTTTLTYRHLPNPLGPYIKGLLQSEVIDVDGEVFTRTRSYADSTGFMTSETRYGVTTTYEPDAFGNVGREVTATGGLTSFSYSWGRVREIATEAHTTLREIRPNGTVASETRGGRTTTYVHDGLLRLRHTQPPGSTNPIVVDYDDVLRTVVETRGTSQLTTTLDGFGRPTGTLNGVGVRTTVRYDAEGRRIYESFPFEGLGGGPTDVGTTTTYDGLGRVLRQTNPDGTYREHAYGPGTVTVRDENGRTTVQAWQAFGDPDIANLVGIRDADNRVWSYTYNGLGRLTSVSTPDGSSRTWLYHAGTDRVAVETHPESGSTSYLYDASGRLAQKTDVNGVVFTYQYDTNDRLVLESAGGRATVIGYEAGSDNRGVTQTASTTTELLYDVGGRLSEKRDTIHGRLFRTRFEHDSSDQLVAVNYPTLHATDVRRRVQFDRDVEGRITRVFEGTTTYASDFDYHASGAVETYKAGNGLETVVTYDPARYWVRSISVGALSLQYEQYDDAGNLESIVDSRAGMNQTFTYDALDRLTAAASGGGYPSMDFAYDVHGNRLTSGGTTYTYEAGTLRLASRGPATFGYDDNGRLRTAPNATYTYTPRGMLEAAAVVGGTTTYSYDADDQRTRKRSGATTTYFVRGADQQVLTEWVNPGPSGQARDFIYAGTRLVAMVRRSSAEDNNDLLYDIVPNGPSVIASITTPGQRALFRFPGVAGRRYSLLYTASNVTGSNCIGWPVAILTPDGTPLVSQTSCSLTTFIDVVTAPGSGTYTIVVDPSGTSTADVAMRLYDVVDATATIVANGPAVPVDIAMPGQKALLTFEGAAGRRYAVKYVATDVVGSNCLAWPLKISNPDGTTLSSLTACGSTVFLEPAPAASVPGTYTITIDPDRFFTADLSVRLYDVTDVIGSLLVDGPPVTANLSIPGQRALLTFSGLEGRRYSAVSAISNVGGGGCITWPLAILNPGGTTLVGTSACSTTTIAGPATADTSGPHTVLVDPNAYGTADVSVRIHDVVDISGTTAVNGTAVPLSLATPGQMARLTFAGAEGQSVTVRLASHSIGWTTVRLLSPDGSQLRSATSGSASFILSPATLAVGGTYTIEVDPADARTGDITVAVTNP